MTRVSLTTEDRRLLDVRIESGQASVPRDALSPTPPGPEGSNGNGLLRVQWVSGAWLLSGLVSHRIFYYPTKFNTGVVKFARFGKIVGKSAGGTPNQFARVAAYWSSEVVGIQRP
jgi:hypothetical protein